MKELVLRYLEVTNFAQDSIDMALMLVKSTIGGEEISKSEMDIVQKHVAETIPQVQKLAVEELEKMFTEEQISVMIAFHEENPWFYAKTRQVNQSIILRSKAEIKPTWMLDAMYEIAVARNDDDLREFIAEERLKL